MGWFVLNGRRLFYVSDINFLIALVPFPHLNIKGIHV